MAAAMMQMLLASGSGGAPSGVSFDGASTGVTLTNANLTVTQTSGAIPSGARSTALKSTGKFYFEGTVGATSTTLGFGLGQSTATFTTIAGEASSQSYATIYGNGDVCAGGGFFTTFAGGNFAPGTVMRVAVDLGAHLIWFTKGSSTNWNTVSGDPAAGTGGITIQNASWA